MVAREFARGGREAGAEGSDHFDPQVTTFRSPPEGIYLIKEFNRRLGPVYARSPDRAASTLRDT